MENGYIKLYRKILNNPLLERDNNAFVVFVRLLLLVDRNSGSYTYGTRKFAASCNMTPSTLYRVMKKLQTCNVIVIKVKRNYSEVLICNWNEYQAGGETQTKRKRNESETKVKTKQEEEGEKNKDTNVSIKAVQPVYGKPEINDLFDFWEQTVGVSISGQKQKNRYAASNLLKQLGGDKLRQLIVGVKLTHNDRYAPRIADFVQLQQKQNELIAWGNRQKNQSQAKVVKV